MSEITGAITSGSSITGALGVISQLDTSDATATTGDILSGKTAYVDGSKITGTISSKGAETFTPTTSNQTINSGQYLSGNQTIEGDSDLVAENIKSGVTIFGVAGSAAGAPENGVTWDTLDVDGHITEMTVYGEIVDYLFDNYQEGVYDYTTTVNINSSEEIGYRAFAYCDALLSAKLNGLVTLHRQAFRNCNGMTKIWIPNTCTTIHTNNSTASAPFYFCDSGLVIYAEAESKPDGWETYWNNYNYGSPLSVVWGTSLEAFNAL